jgi:adenosine deaminase
MPSPEEFARLPKVELHCHVSGSVRPATMRAFVDADGLDAQLWQAYGRARTREGLTAYLARFAAWDATVHQPDRIRQVVAELREDLADDGVVYAELRLRPPTDDDAEWDALMSAAIDGAGADAEDDARVAFMCVLMRGWDEARALREARRAVRWSGRGVVALDVAGDETGDGAEPLAAAVQLARESGLNITAHAGEGAGPESVWQALRLFQPCRIAHGVRSVEDRLLLEALLEQGVHLEMALTSNLQTHCVARLEDHPFRDLLRSGVPVSLNTDNRTISGTTLSSEYAAADLELGELAHVVELAAQASFLPPAQRDQLIARVRESWQGVMA